MIEGGLAPFETYERALCPAPGGDLCEVGSPSTHQWAYPAHTRRGFAELVAPATTNAGAPPCTRVTFSPMRKSPKNLPEGDTPSGYSPEGDRAKSVSLFAPAPPAASRNPLDRVLATKID